MLPVSIQVSPGPKQPLGRGLRLVMYRFVSFSIEKKVDIAACIDTGLNTEQMKAPGTGSDT